VLDPFYPIVDSAGWIARLLPCGIRFVQLRVKDRPAAEIHEEIAAAKALAMLAGAQLVVNDYWQEAIDLRCDFIHLGQDDLAHADIPAIRRAGLRLGVSTHDEGELARALEVQPDYIALGPIYPTTLKEMAFAPQGLARIGEWKRRIGAIPLVAIGGITLERAGAIFDAGADIVSVVTDVTRADDPEARTCAWVEATRSRKTPRGEGSAHV